MLKEKKTLILIALLSAFSIATIACIIIIVLQVNSYAKTKKEYTDLNDYVVEETEPDVTPGRHINTYVSDSSYTKGPGVDPEHKSYELPKVSINFSALVTTNPDTIGWIYIPTLDLSYPIVQSHDNDDYVHASFNGTESKAGCIFNDCRVVVPFSQKTILYGHNMKNGTMFHGLFEIEKDPSKHPDVWIYQTNGAIGHYVISEVKRVDMLDKDVYGVSSMPNTQVVLSTCVKNTKRLVVILEKDWSY